jgi:hypothetical protein
VAKVPRTWCRTDGVHQVPVPWARESSGLLGCLGGLSGNGSAILSMAFLGVLVCFLNWRQLTLHQTLGLTTSTALLIVGFAGVFSGQGHTFTPVAVTNHYSCAPRVETATPRLRRRIERS